MRKWYIAALAALVSLSASAQAPSGVPPVQGKEVAEKQAKDVTPGLLSIDAGVDFSTGYFFRGYRNETRGAVIQPFATVGFNLRELQDIGGTGIDVKPYVGIWNSIHTVAGGKDDPKAWYEADYIGGVEITKGAFALNFVYTYYDAPSGTFDHSQEVGVTLSYDDSGLGLLPFALNPHVGYYREIDNSATFGKHVDPGQYLEFGVEPSFDVKVGSLPVTLSVPTAVGISLDSYYTDSEGHNETFGYGSIGVKASVPLPVPDKFGKWDFHVGVTYLHLFADSVEASNGGGSNEFIGTAGIGWSF
jgi:hypothetical protein